MTDSSTLQTGSATAEYDQTATGGDAGASSQQRQGQQQSPLSQVSQWLGQLGGQGQQGDVPDAERYAAIAAGAIATLLGVRHRSIPGLLVAGAGGALLYHGITGRSVIGRPLGADAEGDSADGGDGQGFMARQRQRLDRGVSVSECFTIGKSREELYGFWRDFTNLPKIMTHLQEVRILDGSDGRRSHWVSRAPAIAGGKVEWDAEMTDDVPNERIAWRSLPGADVENAGEVRFEDSPRGTIVRVRMQYRTPGGQIGRYLAKMLGESPERVVREDLRHFKQYMEVGELPTLIGQPHGTCMGHGVEYQENNSYMPPPNAR